MNLFFQFSQIFRTPLIFNGHLEKGFILCSQMDFMRVFLRRRFSKKTFRSFQLIIFFHQFATGKITISSLKNAHPDSKFF